MFVYVRRQKWMHAAAIAALLVLTLVPLTLPGRAHAGTFAQASLRLDRIAATTATSGRVCAKGFTAGTATTVKVTFPTTSATDYVVGTTAANWTVTTTNLDTGQTAWPGIGTASSVSGKSVTFPSSAISNPNLYCFNFASVNTLTTSSAGAGETTQGTITSQASGPTTIDQTTYSESIITNDQVVVTGTVPPSFTFILSGNTDSFTANLNAATTTSTTGRTITLLSNAQSGWIVWAKDLNNNGGKGALQSVTAGSYDITGTSAAGAASHTFTPATEDYGLGVTINTDAAGGGTVALNAAYDGTATKAGTLSPTAYFPVASSNGTANNDIINVAERAMVSGQTPAASDYTDTITFVGAGVF